MEVNGIVYSKQYGFGKVIGFKDKFVIIVFLGREKKMIIESFLEEVDNEFVDDIINSRFLNNFGKKIANRAMEYNNDIYIKNVTFNDNKVSATVSGTDDYNVVIDYLNGKFKYSCSCPYDYNCKHACALCMYLKDYFDALMEMKDFNEKGAIELSEDIKNYTNRFVTNKGNQSTWVYSIICDLDKNLTDEYLINYLRYLNKIPSYTCNCSVLYRALSLNNKFREVMMNNLNILSSLTFYSNLKSYISTGDRLYNRSFSLFEQIEEYNCDYYFYNFLYENFLLSFLKENQYYFRYEIYLPIAIEKTEMTPKLFSALKKYLTDNRKSDHSLINSLIEKLSFEQRIEIYNDKRIQIKPTYDDIKDLPNDLKMNLIPTLNIRVSDIKDIIEDIEKSNVDENNLAIIICKLRNATSNSTLIHKICRLCDKLSNNKFFKMMIENENGTFYYHRYWFDKKYNKAEYIVSIENNVALDKYFTASYLMDTYDDDYMISFSLESPIGNTVFKCDVNSNNDYFCSLNDITGNLESLETVEIVSYLLDKYQKQIDVDSEIVKEEIRQKRLKERYQQLSYDINIIQNTFSNTSIQLNDSRKAHIEYSFNINEKRPLLKMKIGIDKMYVVKSACDFLNKFRNEGTEAYGKGLVFTHKYSNLNEKDAEIIRLLCMCDFTNDYYGDKKELRISEAIFDKIIGILEDENVQINNQLYNVTLKKLDLDITIDKDYILHNSLADEERKFYPFNKRIYILDNKKKCIDFIEGSKKELALFKLGIKNNGSEIKNVIEEFKEKVYSRFPGYITVAEELKPQFKLSMMNINAYFDFADKKILVRDEYLRDDLPIEEQEITNPDDKNRIQLYHLYLLSLGFVDNTLKDDALVLSFFSMDLSELKEYCNVFLSDSIRNKQILSFSPGVIRITYENNMMQAFYEQSEFTDEELEQIAKAIRRNKKYVQLTGDRIIDISNKKSKEFLEAVDDVGLDTSHLSARNEISMINALKGYARSENCSVDKYLTNMVNDIKNFKKSDLPLPNVNADLRNYQKDGYRWMKILSSYHVGGILADDMGLGKTLQVICVIASEDEKKPNLIICPKSLVFNWKYEFNKFAEKEKVVEIYGSKDERSKIIREIKQDEKVTYFTSYDSLRNDLQDYNISFNYLVIDEAQYIKNVTAQKTVSVKQIKAEHKFALTGTPIENNIIDLWSIFDFIMPDYLEELAVFKSNYNNYDEFTEIVSKRVAPFILRRTKGNVLKDLPEKFEKILAADMTTEQRKVYDAVAKQARDVMAMDNGAFAVLPYLLRLRQICVDPSTYIENFEGTSGKMELLDETISKYLADGHKILIFSSFVKALNIVEKKLKKKKIPYFIITGATDSKDRLEIADKFNDDSKEQICLISLKAGGVGLNLTGADTVIHLDPWWNVSAENQATDRTHRIGQTKSVEVIKIICSNTIEQRVIELQNIKNDLIEKLISNDDSSVSNITIEDIRFVLD